MIHHDYDTWEKEYNPLNNHMNPNAAFGGIMYETFGEEDDYVRRMSSESPRNVWTIISCDEGDFIISGWHYVNVLGYIITKNPSHGDVEVNLYSQEELKDLEP
jgi:hypothetical protein